MRNMDFSRVEEKSRGKKYMLKSENGLDKASNMSMGAGGLN